MGTFTNDADGHLVADNGDLRIVFDATSGAIRRVENLVTGQRLAEAEAAQPWRMTPQGVSSPFLPGNRPPSYTSDSISPSTFSHTIDGDEATLVWTTSKDGLGVEVVVRDGADGAIELWPRVVVGPGAVPPTDFAYPLIWGPKKLGDAGGKLAFPAHSGWLIDRPLDQAPCIAPYPDGYHGCSMQFLAHFDDGSGGFYVGAHDPHSTWKTLVFSSIEISFTHDNWDLRRGMSMEFDYPIVFAPLVRGDWYEAAERYRSWALTAPWSADGPNRDKTDGPRWLYEDVGLCIWGTPCTVDWSDFYRFYADVAQAPLHICTSWDWPAKRPHALGKEGWFPARFHAANVDAWAGHHVTPYMNDCFVSTRAERFFEDWEPNLVLPYSMFPFLPFSYPSASWVQGEGPDADPVVTTDVNYYICPTTGAQRDIHDWRSVKLAADHGMDGACYDISSGNPMVYSRCLRASHGHPPGRGRDIVAALAGVNRSSRDAVRRETGRSFAQGVETIIENVVGSVDFYISRACAGPMGVLEAWTLGPESQPSGGRELIPMFQAVYHDVGPVHEDGWLGLGSHLGDLFYWIVARIVLQWGGVPSMQYATDPPEEPPFEHGPAHNVNWNGSTNTWAELPAPDDGKILFVREMTKARTTFGKPYLGYGRILRPVPFDAGTIDLWFDQTFPGVDSMRNAGTWTVPRVVHGAWADDATGKIGLFFVNLHASDACTIALDCDPHALWGADVDPVSTSLELEPRVVTFVELG